MDAVQGNVRQDGRPPELAVRVSEDKSEAFLSVKAMLPGQQLTDAEVMKFLLTKGIVHGLRTDAIHEFCTADHSHEVVCARGEAPVNEQEPEIQYFFRTDSGKAPMQREDGTVDFRDLGIVQNVKKGDVLCRALPSSPGHDGMNVYGKQVPFRKSHPPRFPTGSHTVVSQDGMELTAAIDGCVEYRKNCLSVEETFFVHGNVDGASGNIDFIGTVVIQGDVLEGFTVKAGGDITVHGMVEGATLDAGGSIMVSNGVNGMNGGTVTAGGNITAKYFQNAVIRCGGDIFADVLMNCNVQAGHSIILRGPKASLMGGRCCAGRQICAKIIGTPSYVKTDVCIDSPDLHGALAGVSAQAGEIEDLQEKMFAQKQAQTALKKQLESIKRAIAEGNRSEQIARLAKMLVQRCRDAENAVADLEQHIQEIRDTPVTPVIDFNVVGLRIIYSGVKITIGTCSYAVEHDSNCAKYYLSESQIISGPVLPSDEKDY